MIDFVGLGIFLYHIRNELGYTLEEAAGASNICARTLYNIENGISKPKLTTLYTLLDVYGVPLSEIQYFYTRDDSTETEIKNLYKKKTRSAKK